MSEQAIKLVHVVDTSGVADKSIGTAAMDEKGRYGFSNAEDEKPYLPAGESEVLADQEVLDSLTFKDHEWEDHIKTQETLYSKNNTLTREETVTEQLESIAAEKEILMDEREYAASTGNDVALEQADKDLDLLEERYKELTAPEDTQEASKEGAKATDKQADDMLNFNSIEMSEEKKQSAEAEQTKEQPIEQPVQNNESFVSKNETIEKDQIFEPAQGETQSLVPASVSKKFTQDGNKFYMKSDPDKVAFSDSGKKLKTRMDGEAITDTMINIAKERGWTEIKVTGSESFKKDVWKNASEQGIAVKGYTPSRAEVAALEAKGVEIPKQGQDSKPEKAVQTAKEKAAEALQNHSSAEAVKNHPELAPYVAAISAVEKKLNSENLSTENKNAILERVRQNAVNSYNEGVQPDVKLKQERIKEQTATAEVSR